MEQVGQGGGEHAEDGGHGEVNGGVRREAASLREAGESLQQSLALRRVRAIQAEGGLQQGSAQEERCREGREANEIEDEEERGDRHPGQEAGLHTPSSSRTEFHSVASGRRLLPPRCGRMATTWARPRFASNR